MSELTGLTENEAAELAYGLLWHMRRVDRHTFDGRLASDARLAIGNAIGADRKRAGVKRAQDFMAAHPMPLKADANPDSGHDMPHKCPACGRTDLNTVPFTRGKGGCPLGGDL